MVSGNTKKILVIKDIPSNIIEEAIIILKSEYTGKEDKNAQDPAHKNKKRDNDFLFKEAEMIINSYIKENKIQITPGRTPFRKRRPVRSKKLVNTIINLSLMASVALLVFIITRFL